MCRPRLTGYERASFELLYKPSAQPKKEQQQQHGEALQHGGQLAWRYEPRATVGLAQLPSLRDGRWFDILGAVVLVGLQQSCAGALTPSIFLYSALLHAICNNSMPLTSTLEKQFEQNLE